MTVRIGEAKNYATWKQAIEAFAVERPQALLMSPARAYVRFLEFRGCLSSDMADQVCSLSALKMAPHPETFGREWRRVREYRTIPGPQTRPFPEG